MNYGHKVSEQVSIIKEILEKNKVSSTVKDEIFDSLYTIEYVVNELESDLFVANLPKDRYDNYTSKDKGEFFKFDN